MTQAQRFLLTYVHDQLFATDVHSPQSGRSDICFCHMLLKDAYVRADSIDMAATHCCMCRLSSQAADVANVVRQLTQLNVKMCKVKVASKPTCSHCLRLHESLLQNEILLALVTANGA